MDDAVRVVVITGSGSKFSTGGNVRGMADAVEYGDRLGRSSSVAYVSRMYRNLLGVEQPIIASLNGDAIGGGATMALHCDIVLAAEGSRIGDPHVLRGLVAGAGPYIWPVMTSLNLAKEYLLTGDAIPVEEAWRVGLVNHVYPAVRAGGPDREVSEEIGCRRSLRSSLDEATLESYSRATNERSARHRDRLRANHVWHRGPPRRGKVVSLSADRPHFKAADRYGS